MSSTKVDQSGLSRCYSFMIEYVLGAVVGVCWTYFVPYLPEDDPYAFGIAIVNDLLGTTVISLLIHYVIKRFNPDGSSTSSEEEGASTEPPVVKSPERKSRSIRVVFKDDFGDMLIQGFSMAISMLHTMVADYLWVWVSYVSTKGESYSGVCVEAYKGTQILAALGLALAVCFLFASLSFLCTKKAEKATTTEKQHVWDLIASSFSYAIGMSFFDALSFSLTCMPNDMYYDFATQIVRAVVLSFLALLFYFYGIPRLSTSSWVNRADLVGGLAEDVVYTIFANSWISAYKEPVYYSYSDDADMICYLVALGLTLLFLVVIYNGWVIDAGDESVADRTPRLINQLMGWLVMVSWWDPLDSSFTEIFISSTGLDADYSFVISIAVALLFTALSALLAAIATILFPKDLKGLKKARGLLPSWIANLFAIPARFVTTKDNDPPAEEGSGSGSQPSQEIVEQQGEGGEGKPLLSSQEVDS